MPKVLLSRLPESISETLAGLKDGLAAAGTAGIVAKVIENKIDFQVEVIMDLNAIPRTQTVDMTQNRRTVSGGAEQTIQVNDAAETVVTDASSEVGSDSQANAGESHESGVEAGTESGSASESEAGSQESSNGTAINYTFIDTSS